jgi:hypothetical protein
MDCGVNFATNTFNIRIIFMRLRWTSSSCHCCPRHPPFEVELHVKAVTDALNLVNTIMKLINLSLERSVKLLGILQLVSKGQEVGLLE